MIACAQLHGDDDWFYNTNTFHLAVQLVRRSDRGTRCTLEHPDCAGCMVAMMHHFISMFY